MLSRVEIEGLESWADAPQNTGVLQGLIGSAIVGIAMINFKPGSGWTIPILLVSAFAIGTLGYLIQKNRMAMPFLSFGPEGFSCRSLKGGRLFEWREIAAVRFSRFGLHVAFNDPSLQQEVGFDWTEFWSRGVVATFAVLTDFRGATLSSPLGGFFMPYSAIANDEHDLKRSLRPLFERYAPLFEEFAS